MLKKHRQEPRRICEVGCGAGEVLTLLQKGMKAECGFWGYDVSP
jgi:ubiquinone/menaquinone biosynthesis C-methylase UbiE